MKLPRRKPKETPKEESPEDVIGSWMEIPGLVCAQLITEIEIEDKTLKILQNVIQATDEDNYAVGEVTEDFEGKPFGAPRVGFFYFGPGTMTALVLPAGLIEAGKTFLNKQEVAATPNKKQKSYTYL